jgi:predicted ATP-dependent serine protease
MANVKDVVNSNLVAPQGIKRGTNINTLKVDPRLEERVLTGIGWVDDVFGAGDKEQGITPSTTILFTGTPGAGKTTGALQIADAWTAQGNVCLYNTNEESALQVRKVTKRLNLKSGFIIGEDRLVPEMIAHARFLMERDPKAKLLVIGDSIQVLDDGFYANGTTNSNTPVRVTNMLTAFAKEVFAVAMLIGQVNKDGKFAGKQAIKHAVDVHAHLSIDQKPGSETFGKRIFKVEKNRFGFSGVGYFLGMDGKKGLYEDGAWSPLVED